MRKTECTVCGWTFWVTAKAGNEFCRKCDGAMRIITKPKPKRPDLPQIKCTECQVMFTPKFVGAKTCSGLCAVRRSNRRGRERAAKNYTAKCAAGYVHRYTGEPWAWLEKHAGDDDEISQRKILHTLEEQSESGQWPWPDVLAGAGPCLMDECPF